MKSIRHNTIGLTLLLILSLAQGCPKYENDLSPSTSASTDADNHDGQLQVLRIYEQFEKLGMVSIACAEDSKDIVGEGVQYGSTLLDFRGNILVRQEYCEVDGVDLPDQIYFTCRLNGAREVSFTITDTQCIPGRHAFTGGVVSGPMVD